MSNSTLVSVTNFSPNHSGKRTMPIDRITPHCVVGQVSAEWIGNYFLNRSVQASCNYGIGSDGKIALVVDEGNRSWCSSSNANDQRAITIECASDKSDPFAMTDAVYQSLINLCADICKRNGKSKLLWIDNKDKALAYTPKSDEMLLTVHRWFAPKSCPGDWLYNRLGDLAAKVTAKLGGTEPSLRWQTIDDVPPSPQQAYYKQMIQHFIDIGVYAGKGKDSKGRIILDITEDMLRNDCCAERLAKLYAGK